mmetsp:Transcript_9828/g.31036  ORF Transcript_9828/g.31036 Transcript_9828/m.31036 type:complete len:316 (-) Transcript_9828:366-1313(-)
MTSTASLLAYTFNQDATCLAIGTDRGYQIFTCEPWASAHSCSEGGVGVVELLHSSSLVALVGAGTRPGESTRRLVMLNTRTNTSICELNFSSSVLRVRMNASRLLVVLETRTHIFELSSMKLLHTLETAPPPHPLCNRSIEEYVVTTSHRRLTVSGSRTCASPSAAATPCCPPPRPAKSSSSTRCSCTPSRRCTRASRPSPPSPSPLAARVSRPPRRRAPPSRCTPSRRASCSTPSAEEPSPPPSTTSPSPPASCPTTAQHRARARRRRRRRRPRRCSRALRCFAPSPHRARCTSGASTHREARSAGGRLGAVAA